MYKDKCAHGPEICPKAHENLRAFSCISGLINLKSSIQCPCGVGLHHMLYAIRSTEKQSTTNSSPSKTDKKVGKFNGRNKCENVKSLKLSTLIFSQTKYLKESKKWKQLETQKESGKEDREIDLTSLVAKIPSTLKHNSTKSSRYFGWLMKITKTKELRKKQKELEGFIGKQDAKYK